MRGQLLQQITSANLAYFKRHPNDINAYAGGAIRMVEERRTRLRLSLVKGKAVYGAGEHI